MGLLAQNAPTESGRTYTCKLREFYSSPDLDDDDRAAIDARLADPSLSNQTIGDWLGMSGSTIGKHRNGNKCRHCHG